MKTVPFPPVGAADWARDGVRAFISWLMLAALLLTLAPGANGIERRKPQFPTEPSYLIFPLPYSLPGIGTGIILTGLLGNVGETNMDAYGLLITGDAEGWILGLDEIPLINEHLFLNLFSQHLTSVTVNFYETRGIDSDPDNYNLIELSLVDSKEAQLTATFFERRLEFFGGVHTQKVKVPRVRDSDGNLIQELDPPFTQTTKNTTLGTVFDYTDDRQDPRKGVRLQATRSNTPNNDPNEAEFYVWNYTSTFYVPIGDVHTLAFYYFQSDAVVTREGLTDEDAVRKELDFGCAPNDAQCLRAEQEVVGQFIDSRRNGTSTSLGGQERLRSYPEERFSGAHTRFYSVELRLNLSQEVTPFDYFIWKDVRTGVQLALFAETGTVAETRDQLGEKYKSSYGAGLRLISASGYVYRADLATGDEGTETVIIFNYPF